MSDEIPPALRDVLSVVDVSDLLDGVALPGLPGTWSQRPDGSPGARVVLAPGEWLWLDGEAVSGVVDVAASDGSSTDLRTVALENGDRVAALHFADAGSGTTVIGVLSDSSPRLRAYRSITTYPQNEDWRIAVQFTPAGDHERVSAV